MLYFKNKPVQHLRVMVKKLGRRGGCFKDISSRVDFRGLPWWLSSKESAYNAGDAGSIRGSGRSPGGGHGNYSSILAWRIPWSEEPSGLQSIRPQRVWQDWSSWARTQGWTKTADIELDWIHVMKRFWYGVWFWERCVCIVHLKKETKELAKHFVFDEVKELLDIYKGEMYNKDLLALE